MTRFFGPIAAALIAVTGISAAAAQERPYAPPVGSHWHIVTQKRTDTTSGGVASYVSYKVEADLTIDARTDQGFRVTYVNRAMSAEGTSSNVPMLKAVCAALTGLVVKASLDADGKPLRVENLVEAQAQMRHGIDVAVDLTDDKPAAKDVFRQMMTGLLIGSAEQSAQLYLDELPSLARGQNTGLKLGEERRMVETSTNPLGGPPLAPM